MRPENWAPNGNQNVTPWKFKPGKATPQLVPFAGLSRQYGYGWEGHCPYRCGRADNMYFPIVMAAPSVHPAVSYLLPLRASIAPSCNRAFIDLRHISRTITHVSSRSFHVYKPLQPNEIRLIDLQPGRGSEPLRCRLRSVELTGNSPYESLSYCWGWNKAEVEIGCDDGVVPVTKNLFSALRHLRNEHAPRRLWIDAICINQADIEERGHQVSLMRGIFKLSERTIVWLGEESEDSAVAIQLIHELARASQQHGTSSWLSHESRKVLFSYDPAWRALTRLLQRPWFHRTWIVQEASVARDVSIVCGHALISWDEFVRAVQYAVDLGVFIGNGGSRTYQALRLFETRSTFQQNRLPSLHDILLSNRSFLATDARDKVYGLLSLANTESVQSMGVQPDYHVSTEQLYKKIAHALLERSDLSAFSASGVEKKPPDIRLPSWVSDWRASDPSSPLTSPQLLDFGDRCTHSNTSIPHFHAAGTTISSPTFRSNENLLGLEGILIDEVEVVGTLSHTRYLDHVSHMFELWIQCRDVLEQLRNWEQVARARSKDSYITGEKQLDAYWKTLCAGRVPENLPSARHDPRFKYYMMICPLRSFVRVTTRCFPRSEEDTWYNRFFYSLFRTAWRVFGLTPAKVQRIGFPPESQLSTYRRMIRTKEGYIALAPRCTKPGDWIGVFKGGKLPLVVRQDGDYFELIGESYVHGMMKGEAWNESKCKLMWFK